MSNYHKQSVYYTGKAGETDFLYLSDISDYATTFQGETFYIQQILKIINNFPRRDFLYLSDIGDYAIHFQGETFYIYKIVQIMQQLSKEKLSLFIRY